MPLSTADATHPISSIQPVRGGAELPGGTRLLHGQYQIERPLLAGGFGLTYLARDSLDRRVVIKECFCEDLCRRQDDQIQPSTEAHHKTFKAILRGFMREAHLLARVTHPNVVPVHQVFRENGTAYIAMEFIAGQDLFSLIDDANTDQATETLSQAAVLHLLDQALNALQTLHGHGILHRDISPDNLMLDPHNRLVLIDFGAACSLHRADDPLQDVPVAVKDGYSPPELYQPGSAAQAATDIYALGATFAYVLSGKTPISGPDRLAAVLAGAPDPLCAHLQQCCPDPVLRDTLRKALALLPIDRWQTASDWRAALCAGAIPSSPALCAESSATDRAAQSEVLPATQPPSAQHPSASTSLSPPPPAEIKARIASLVADTNQALTTAMPRARRQQADPVVAVQDIRPKPMVDLFGAPIRDVDSWLNEQEALSQRVTAPAVDHNAASPPSSHAHDPAASAQKTAALPSARGASCGLRGFMARCFKRQTPSASPNHQEDRT